ncbi:MAG TPA: YggT family protein [Solirubrobacterales bacterium]|nr:YggT family protein [Solirubrobacterales bacterium]
MILASAKISVADYVAALFTVYFILILLNILLSWVPRMPYRPWLRAVVDFITETTNPYINFFRRFTRPVGVGGVGSIDIAPMIAIVVLLVAEGVLVGAILR